MLARLRSEDTFPKIAVRAIAIIALAASLQVLPLYASADSDLDGIPDANEGEYGTDPSNPDTDHDGLLDGEEVDIWGSNPTVKDTDGGGVEDGQEVLVDKTDPTDPTDDLRDDDQDGYPIPGDCDDLDPSVFPGAPELRDGVDNDCDGALTQADCLIQASAERLSGKADLLAGVAALQRGMPVVEERGASGLVKAPGLIDVRKAANHCSR